jgi:hypothetical protein
MRPEGSLKTRVRIKREGKGKNKLSRRRGGIVESTGKRGGRFAGSRRFIGFANDAGNTAPRKRRAYRGGDWAASPAL